MGHPSASREELLRTPKTTAARGRFIPGSRAGLNSESVPGRRRLALRNPDVELPQEKAQLVGQVFDLLAER